MLTSTVSAGCSRKLRLVPVFLPLQRCYATTSAASKKAKKKPPPSPTPAPKPSTSKTSLRNRMLLAASKNYQAVNRRPPEPEAKEDMNEEEQLKHVEALTEQQRWLESQGREVLGVQMPMLDLMVPYAAGVRNYSEYGSIRALYRQWLQNRINDGKNAFSMRHIAVSDAFPGVAINRQMGWLESFTTYSRRAFQAQSLKANAWVAPMRQEFLDRYIKLNKAIVLKEPLNELAMRPFIDEFSAIVRQRALDNTYFWNFHREVSPTRILSLRAVDGDFGKEMPATGSRIAIQALVRFDTEQSVEIYDRHGKALHEVGPAEEQQQSGRGGKTLHRVAAVPKRVTEYLVLDRAMYLVGSRWRFRARIEALPGRTVAI
ncbi:hypothetical protein MIND_00137000 [Mycena indigotica]|uniref:Tim44-like domain-containing protein n=1 Tax=Mycena indigotica TaxID=2126181 RepID=A0A8H6WIJ0_9AGAR|nr:uncharacterized protein MIND_00137000 [Mycena indigotica]KAF7316188.1 hypothetical protein MIND_00137000 [Mycena indigotica]